MGQESATQICRSAMLGGAGPVELQPRGWWTATPLPGPGTAEPQSESGHRPAPRIERALEAGRLGQPTATPGRIYCGQLRPNRLNEVALGSRHAGCAPYADRARERRRPYDSRS